MLVLRDRELKETRNLYSAVKDMLALQPSPEIQVNDNHIETLLYSIYMYVLCNMKYEYIKCIYVPRVYKYSKR